MGDYEYVNISNFAVLGMKLCLEENGDLRTFIVDKSWWQIFFQTFWVDYFSCEYLNLEKNMLTVVSRGSFFKGLDNKIIGFVHM